MMRIRCAVRAVIATLIVFAPSSIPAIVLSSGHDRFTNGRRMNDNTLRIPAPAALAFLLAFSISAPSFAGPSADIRRLENDFNAAYAANDLVEGRTDLPACGKEWAEYIKVQYSPAPKAGKS